MLIPKKQKHRKQFRNRSALKGKAHRGSRLSFGTYGIQAMTAGEVTSRQIEAARRAATRFMKRMGQLWIRIFPQITITRKANEVPMGSGKGAPDHYVAYVRPGNIIFEIEGVPEEVAREALRLAGHKLPVKTKFISTEIH